MRTFSTSLILVGTLLAHTAMAMDKAAVVSPTLEAFLGEAKAASNADAVRKILEGKKAVDPEGTWNLCREDILGNNEFYKRVGELSLGISKRNTITSFCETVRLEREKAEPGKIEHTKPAAAPEKPQQKPMMRRGPAAVPATAPKTQVEPPKPQPKRLSDERKVHWNKVDVETSPKGNLQERQDHLKAQEAMVQQNLEMLKAQEDQAKKAELHKLAAQLVEVRKELESSRKYYDNLSAAILGIREDLEHIHQFRDFVQAHHHDAPDVFIDGFMKAFPEWFNAITNPTAAAQIPLALDESRKSLDALQKGELELSAIVRQMEGLRPKE